MREVSDVWAGARSVTPARIGLPRTGASLATAELLDFRLAHARARDAVHAALDFDRLLSDVTAIDWDAAPVVLESAVPDRQSYLLRPDLGRQLSPESAATLARAPCDLAIVLADGLSARAVQDHAATLLAALVPILRGDAWKIAPLALVRHGRVAIGDAIALRLGASCVLVLIGERPGLSSADSLGAYITWAPNAATTDADRNCVSNIRPHGIPPVEAAYRIAQLLARMRRLHVSGVALKDESDAGGSVLAESAPV